MTTKQKIAKTLALFNLRFGRGNSHLGFFVTFFKLAAYYTIVREPIRAVFGIELPLEWGLLGSVVYVFLAYLIGWIDQRVGFWKAENNLSIEEMNPFFKEWREEMNKKFDEMQHL